MKSIKLIIASILVLCATQLSAQNTPIPPRTPTTNSESSFSYSETTSDDDGMNKNTNVSISISNSDDNYSLRAKFPEEKYMEVFNVLMEEMNARNMTESNGKHIWESNSNNEEVYKLVLSSTKLNINLDKDVASESLTKKFVTLGKTLRTVISGADNEARRNAERIQRDAERLRRDAERMQREADRIKREADRMQQDDARRFRDDARALADKARLLADRARDIGTEANHQGGVSMQVKMLLGDSKTYYKNSTKSTSNWTWPAVQKEIISALKKENLISSENDISFTYDHSGMYANGSKLDTRQVNLFNGIFYKHNIFKGYGFSFYKSQSNMVIVSDDADIEGLVNDLVSKKFINSPKEKALFQINGDVVYKNGNQLSTKDLEVINSLLHKNNIIPAPGKIFEIIKSGGYKVGYAIDDRSHFGTWKFKN